MDLVLIQPGNSGHKILNYLSIIVPSPENHASTFFDSWPCKKQAATF